MNQEKVCIIGMGYVGLTLAVAMSDVGYNVIGIETNNSILDCLKNKEAHFSEVGLNEKLRQVIEDKKFTFSNNLSDAASATTYIITVGTPVLQDKSTNFASIDGVCNGLKNILKDGDLVILRSTIQVGTTENFVKPILDQSNCKYHLAFCPERTLEGKALLELSELPQIIGAIDEESSKRANQLFSLLSQEIVNVPSVKTAELVKLANNTFRDYTFAFANELAQVSDALGVSAVEVIHAANHNYPRCQLPIPGPVGGPCLEKDPYILASSLEGTGTSAQLALLGRKVNEQLPVWTIRALLEKFALKSKREARSISICGLAFKGRPETSDLRGSLAFAMVEHILEILPEAKIRGWDPVSPYEETKSLGIDICETFEDACVGADIVLFQNNHVFFQGEHIEKEISTLSENGLVFDYWGNKYNRFKSLPNEIEYLTLGSMNVQF